MINPKKQDLKLYKGATFKLAFRIKGCGGYTDTTLWNFKLTATDKIGGTVVFERSSGNSPADFTMQPDSNYLWSCSLTPAQTKAIIQKGKLPYQLDATAPGGEVQRRMVGEIQLYESVAA